MGAIPEMPTGEFKSVESTVDAVQTTLEPTAQVPGAEANEVSVI